MWAGGGTLPEAVGGPRSGKLAVLGEAALAPRDTKRAFESFLVLVFAFQLQPQLMVVQLYFS